MRLYVGNLPKEITDAELNSLAVKFGTVRSSKVVRERSGVSKGFGFVDFVTSEEARAAIAGLDGTEVDGRALKVSESRNQAPADVLGGRF